MALHYMNSRIQLVLQLVVALSFFHDAAMAQVYVTTPAGPGNTWAFPASADPGRTLIVDFDDDGDGDLLWQAGPGQPVRYSRNEGNGNFTELPLSASPFSGSYSSLPADIDRKTWWAVDFSGDGLQDLWIAMDGGAGIYFKNNANQMTMTASPFPARTDFVAEKVVVGRISGGKLQDLLFQTSSGWQFGRNMGTGSFSYLPLQYSPVAGLPLPAHQKNVFVADWNADGFADLWFADAASSGTLFMGNGMGKVVAVSSASMPALEPASVNMGDFDGDGDLDIVYRPGHAPGPFMLAQNITNGAGLPVFDIQPLPGSIVAGIFPDNAGVMHIADFDGDGDVDIWSPGNPGEFSQQSGTPPQLVATEPIDAATNVPLEAEIFFTFNEPVEKGRGRIWIKLPDQNGESHEVSVSDKIFPVGSTPAVKWGVTPSMLLKGGSNYTVSVDRGAFRSAATGLAYAGIDESRLRFSTIPNTPPVITGITGDVVNYTEGGEPVLVDFDSDGTVIDAESLDFKGGSFSAMVFTPTWKAGDQLRIKNVGGITTDSTNVYYNSELLGTYTTFAMTGSWVYIQFTTTAATPAAATALLRAITYSSSSDSLTASARTIRFTLYDGDGADIQGIGMTVNVWPMNDPPVINVPSYYTLSEDSSIILSGISFSDPDPETNLLVNFTVTEGGLGKFALPTGGNVASTMQNWGFEVWGPLTEVNNFIQSVRYYATPNYAGNTLAFTITARDELGARDTAVIPLRVSPVNDTPAILNINTFVVFEDIGAAIRPLYFSDHDAGSGTMTARFRMALGTLSGESAFGAIVERPTQSELILTGTLDAIHKFIDSARLRYMNIPNNVTTDTLYFVLNDDGNTGAGPASGLTASAKYIFEVRPVNDAPVVTGPSFIAGTEDTPFFVKGITVSDVDADTLSVNFSAQNRGTIRLVGPLPPQLTVTSDITIAVTLKGPIDALNAYLAGDNVQCIPPLNQVSTNAVIVGVGVYDNGASGTGGSKIANLPIRMSLAAVNDTPSITKVPPVLQTVEDTPVTIQPVTFADVDAGSQPVKVTFSATGDAPKGTFTTTSSTVVTTTGSGTSSIELTGSIANINAFIAAGSLSFLPAPNDARPLQEYSILIDDNGNTGVAGNHLFDTAYAQIAVTAMNDSPALALPANQSLPVNGTVTFSSANGNHIQVIDADGPDETIRIQLSSPTGKFTLSTVSGLVFQAGDGSNDADMQFEGTLANVNAALNGATFTPNMGTLGQTTMTIHATDAGGVQTSGQIVFQIRPLFVRITTVTMPNGETYTEEQPLSFTIGFSKPVVLTGMPLLPVQIGEKLRWARYVSSNGNRVTFEYLVAPDDVAPDGIRLGSSIDLNGGTITDMAGNPASLAVAAATGGAIPARNQETKVIEATNIITPNGDGINDRWVVANIHAYPDNEVRIYDRTGRLIYHKRGYANEWNATYNGTPLAEGTYYYQLSPGAGKPVMKGFITVVRDR